MELAYFIVLWDFSGLIVVRTLLVTIVRRFRFSRFARRQYEELGILRKNRLSTYSLFRGRFAHFLLS